MWVSSNLFFLRYRNFKIRRPALDFKDFPCKLNIGTVKNILVSKTV